MPRFRGDWVLLEYPAIRNRLASTGNLPCISHATLATGVRQRLVVSITAAITQQYVTAFSGLKRCAKRIPRLTPLLRILNINFWRSTPWKKLPITTVSSERLIRELVWSGL